jgi:DNA-binding CsgD family transcriptional regulator
MADQIVGRREELALLATFLADVPAGGQALLLEGEAGIGKTALWHEGVRAARERGLRVLLARPTHSEAHTAFAALGDLVEPVVASALARLVPVQRRALEVALLLREPDGAPPDTRLLGVALLSLVRTLSTEQPVLVAIDDVQWLDATSAEVITFMLRRVDADPVAVLATVRGAPASPPLELDRTFPRLRRLPMAPLSIGAIHRLLWGRLALALPRPVLVRVYATTGGNPFFALELGRAIAAGTIGADSADVTLPESLRAVVAQRLAALPERARETLVAVAALTAPSVAVLEPLGGTLLADLEEAQRRGVIELHGDRIRFAHPLLAPACYEAMPQHRRRDVHRRLADLEIEPEERARHLAIAASGPHEQIAAALDAAAHQARRRGAANVAAELAVRAVELTPRSDAPSVARRCITASARCVQAGDIGQATALLQDAVSTAEAGPLRAEAMRELAEVRAKAEGNPVAIELLERALREPGVEARERAIMLGSLASKIAVRGDSADSRDALGHAHASLALAEAVGDPEVLVSSLTTVADIVFWRTGDICSDLLDRAIAIHARTDGGLDRDPRLTLAHELGRADRYRDARALWQALIGEAATQLSPGLATLLFFQARMEVGSGEWQAVARLCDDAMDVGRQTGHEAMRPLCTMILAEIDAYRGESERARTAIPELLEQAARMGWGGASHRLRRALASLELSVGDARAAWSLLAPLLADVEVLDEVGAQLSGSVAIESLVVIGDLARAERLLELLDERAARSNTALRAFADRGRGLVRAARGDALGAIAALERAATEPQPPQEANPFELARALLLLGSALRRAQRKRDARHALDRSLALFDRLGARLWAERTRSELRRIGGRSASASVLSETERQIVELVVAGRRNSDVAAELSLSPNTVAWNLSKVYRKLGVSSRTELAARIADEPKSTGSSG